MQNILKNCFKLNLRILRVFGLYPTEKCNHIRKVLAYIWYVIAMVPGCVLACLNFFLDGDVDSQTYNNFTTFGIILFTPKLFCFLLNSDDIQNCIAYFDVTFSMVLNDAQKAIIRECDRICSRNSTLFLSCIAFGFSGCTIVWYIQDYRKHLPLNVWLPFNYETRPNLYLCIYAMLALDLAYVGITCSAIDPLAAGLLCHASGQLKLLKEELYNLDLYVDEEIVNTNSKICRAIPTYNKIKQSVGHYKNIIHFVNKCEQCFSAMVFIQFAASTFTIGMCCLQMTKVENFNITSMAIALNSGIVIIEVYFYCYYGSTVFEENNSICTAMYMSNWFEYDIKSRRALLILMERSKRPMIVTAGKVLDLSLETFTKLLKASYSILAILRNYY